MPMDYHLAFVAENWMVVTQPDQAPDMAAAHIGSGLDAEVVWLRCKSPWPLHTNFSQTNGNPAALVRQTDRFQRVRRADGGFSRQSP